MTYAPISDPITPPVFLLVSEAINRRLAVCAGAGLSVGSGLPSGSQLAQDLHQRFIRQLAGYCCDHPNHLPSVATAVASLPSGLEVLQRSIVELAHLDTAPPNYAHRLLALLVAEGALQLVTTNWDNCVERGWEGEHILAARDASEAEDLQRAHVLKIHGCCSRPATLLVTEDQLRNPPLWTAGFFHAQIMTSTMVFVGVGDVAPYVRERIQELAAYVDGARVRVVSPRVVEGWDESQWKDVLPTLSEDRKIPKPASTFVDELARGWLHRLLEELDILPDHVGVSVCRSAFGSLTALQALTWLRRAATDWTVGKSVVLSAEAPAALEAVAVLASDYAQANPTGTAPAIQLEHPAAVRLAEERVEILLARPGQPTGVLEQQVRRRAEAVASMLGVVQVTVLCSSSMAVGLKRSALEQDDVFTGVAEPDDLITGPAQVPVKLLWADKLLEAA